MYITIAQWVIGVGGCNSDDTHYYQSSVGPAADGGIKPDIIAPGVGVNTSSVARDRDDYYTTASGTSMSCPHVAGVIALLLVRDPDMTYEEAYDIITTTAETNLTLNRYDLDRYCKEGTIDEVPNIFTGYGRLHALRAVQEQTRRLGGKVKMYFQIAK